MTVNELVFGVTAPVYDLMSANARWSRHCAELTRHFGRPDRPRVVLDLGTGPGVSAIGIKRACPDDRVLGFDIARPMLERARLNDCGRCDWIRGDGLRLPFADGVVDVVTGHSYLYLVPDRTQALSEARRVLRPGGRIVLLEPRRQTLLGDSRSVLRSLRHGPRFATMMAGWRVFARAHGAFATGELEAMFVAAGFSDPRTDAAFDGLGWLAQATAE